MTTDTFVLVVMPVANTESGLGRAGNTRTLYESWIRYVIEEGMSLKSRWVEPGRLEDTEIPEVIRLLSEASAIVFVVVGCDPDVLYLLGVCHGLNLPVLVLTERAQRLPGFLTRFVRVEYAPDLPEVEFPEFRQGLLRGLTALFAPDQSLSNPIQDFMPIDKRPVSYQQLAETVLQRNDFAARLKAMTEQRDTLRRAIDQARKLKSYSEAIPLFEEPKPEPEVASNRDISMPAITFRRVDRSEGDQDASQE